MSANIEIYSRKGCIHCGAARRLLKANSISFVSYDIVEEPEREREMLTRAEGATTVPQIFVDGKLLGGNAELQALAAAGDLRSALNA